MTSHTMASPIQFSAIRNFLDGDDHVNSLMRHTPWAVGKQNSTCKQRYRNQAETKEEGRILNEDAHEQTCVFTNRAHGNSAS